MDESYPGSSPFASLQSLLDAVEQILLAETHHDGATWISIDRLNDGFTAKYPCLPEAVVQAHNYPGNLRSLLKLSRRFAIYGTPFPDQYYVALLSAAVPHSVQRSPRPQRPKIKRSWKVDGRLVKMLREEKVQENYLQQEAPHRGQQQHRP